MKFKAQERLQTNSLKKLKNNNFFKTFLLLGNILIRNFDKKYFLLKKTLPNILSFHENYSRFFRRMKNEMVFFSIHFSFLHTNNI